MMSGEFIPLKEDDYIIQSEMHYVIESGKVFKDIKKLKDRLKKGWPHCIHIFFSHCAAWSNNNITEKPVWDSENWPLVVDFIDSKVHPSSNLGRKMK